jgi:hypothetical protein
VQKSDSREAEPLTEDTLDELFAGEAQNIFILAFDVIKANYSSLFQKLGGPFGKRLTAMMKG